MYNYVSNIIKKYLEKKLHIKISQSLMAVLLIIAALLLLLFGSEFIIFVLGIVAGLEIFSGII